MTAFFKNDSFPFAVENALGEGYHQTTDTGGREGPGTAGSAELPSSWATVGL
jgi:hypothetical protein